MICNKNVIDFGCILLWKNHSKKKLCLFKFGKLEIFTITCTFEIGTEGRKGCSCERAPENFWALCKILRKTASDHLNFPMGKMDHNDEGDVKQTAFRELQETGVKSTDEIKNATGPFEVALPLKHVKFGKKSSLYTFT